MNFKLPPKLKSQLDSVVTFFKKEYPQVKLYLVGGAVRDIVMGRELFDLDIECFGIDEKSFDRAMKLLGAKGVGKSFFVYKFGDIDLSLPRIEKKVGIGHKGFEVKLAKDTKEASRRRDFTMNALMLDLATKRVVDHWGGLEDIKRGLIRVVDPKTFTEDSLRVLRAMQFSARLGFKIEKQSRELMCEVALDDLSKQRIFWEFEKMFNASYLHYGLFALADLRIDQKVLDIRVEYKEFKGMALKMAKASKRVDEHMRPYLFLYILSCSKRVSSEELCEKIGAPNIYKKVLKLQKCPPKKITERFLGALALKMPIKQWLGVYRKNVVPHAKRLGIYEKMFDPGIRPADLLEEGFTGKALGDELRRRTLFEVRKRFKKDAVV